MTSIDQNLHFLNIDKITKIERRRLVLAFPLALLLELILLTLFAMRQHWLAHPQKTTGLDENTFIAVDLFEMPQKSYLTEKVTTPRRQAQDITLAPSKSKSLRPSPATATPEAENQTRPGSGISANHGPVALVAPLPKIPERLQDENIDASVLIEFLVNSLGHSTPRIVSSSGNEELDHLALEATQKWQFRPAEENHHAIDSKIRLRIHFQVE